ncbi:hypothetical protein GN956_G17608 [Arapaima gigas]
MLQWPLKPQSRFPEPTADSTNRQQILRLIRAQEVPNKCRSTRLYKELDGMSSAKTSIIADMKSNIPQGLR